MFAGREGNEGQIYLNGVQAQAEQPLLGQCCSSYDRNTSRFALGLSSNSNSSAAAALSLACLRWSCAKKALTHGLKLFGK